MAAKRRGFTRRNIKRNALGQFARVSGSAHRGRRNAGAFVRSKAARSRLGRRVTVDRLYHSQMRSIRKGNRKLARANSRKIVGNKVRMGVNSARASALSVKANRLDRQRKKLSSSVLNYYVHGKQDRTFKRYMRKARKGKL